MTYIHDWNPTLADDPTRWRWRATFEFSSYGAREAYAVIQAYPVVKLTEMGAWIDEFGTVCHDGTPVVRTQSGRNIAGVRLVMNGSGQAWAKPTRDEALHSLAYRLKRRAEKTARDMELVMAAIKFGEEHLKQPALMRDARLAVSNLGSKIDTFRTDRRFTKEAAEAQKGRW